jgi:sorting nexin-25
MSDVDLERPILVAEIMSQPVALSYWMEFMERRQRSSLPEFWLLVQSLADPLQQSIQSPDKDLELAKEDASMLWSLHFSRNQQLMATIGSARDIAILEAFATGTPTALDVQKVRSAIEALAVASLQEMQAVDLPDFRSSDLFIRALQVLSRDKESAQSLTPSLYSSPNTKLKPKIVQRTGTAEPKLTTPATLPPPPSFGFLFGTREEAGADRAPLFGEVEQQEADEDLDDFVQVETMEAIQEALSSIIADSRPRLMVRTATEVAPRVNANVAPLLQTRSVSETINRSAGEPTTDYFDHRHVSSPLVGVPESPGDKLSESTELTRVDQRIDTLQHQTRLISSLISQSPTSQELRILRRSLKSLKREISSLELQRDVAAESELVPHRTRVLISGTSTAISDGKEYVLCAYGCDSLSSHSREQLPS